MALILEKTENASECEQSGRANRDFFLDLPEDLQRLMLCSYIGPQCTVNLSTCSSILRALCNNDDLWKDFCCRELRIKPKQLELPHSYTAREGNDSLGGTQVGGNRLEAGPVLSYYQLYSQLLHPFRGLLHKLLVSYTSAYGEILTLTYTKGRIIGEVWWLPENITDNMKPVVNFVICLDRDGKPMVVHGFSVDESGMVSFPANSLHSYIHQLEAPRIGDVPVQEDTSWSFAFRCRSPEFGKPWTNLMARMKEDGISLPSVRSTLGFSKFEAFFAGVEKVHAAGVTRNIPCCRYEHRVQTVPAPVVFSSGLALPLGFFKGIYGARGNELIKVEYVEDTRSLRVIKMTGDYPRIPAGRIAFEFSIDRAVVLSLEQQDVDSLEDVHHTGPFHAVDRLPTSQQDFRFSMYMNVYLRERVEQLIGDTCQYRLTGHGTTGRGGPDNPVSAIANMIVFSPDKFVLWLHGYYFAAFFLKVASDDLFCAYY